MPRNLYNRVELVIPIEDEAVRDEMLDVLELSLADDAGCWDLDSDGGWTPPNSAMGTSPSATSSRR